MKVWIDFKKNKLETKKERKGSEGNLIFEFRSPFDQNMNRFISNFLLLWFKTADEQ
jgi:hypothetical protein